ncbi:MAG: hypothetical protein AAGG07_05505 [Planctomycetota bacterium]
MSVKPWQVVVMVAGLGAGVFGVVSVLRGSGPPIAQSRLAVDVTTGVVYRVSNDRTVVFPARSPETGERSIFPVEEREDGWYINERMIESLVRRFGDDIASTRVEDAESGRVSVSGSPVSYNP